MTRQRRCRNVENSYEGLGEWREDRGYAGQIRKIDHQTLEWTCHWFVLVLPENHMRQTDPSVWEHY